MSTPAKSWDHAVRTLQPSERMLGELPRLCQHPRCTRPAVFSCSFRFVSSKRTGRRGTMNRRACLQHAQTFAATHGLSAPEVPAA